MLDVPVGRPILFANPSAMRRDPVTARWRGTYLNGSSSRLNRHQGAPERLLRGNYLGFALV
jgi:hypothetical protein